MFQSRLCVLALLVAVPACGKQPAEPTAWVNFSVNRAVPGSPDTPKTLEPVATDVVPMPREVTRKPAATTLAGTGRQLFLKLQCATCHSGKADAKAPNLERLFGTKVALEGDQIADADEAYLVESVRDPKAKVAQGWKPIMPAYGEKQISAEELKALVGYLKELKAGDLKRPDEIFPSPVGAPTGK